MRGATARATITPGRSRSTISPAISGASSTITAPAAPTHFVVGEHDRLPTVALARTMAADVPGAELTVIPDAGHLSNIENAEVFNRSVMDFLLRHPGADSPRAPAVAGTLGQRGV